MSRCLIICLTFIWCTCLQAQLPTFHVKPSIERLALSSEKIFCFIDSMGHIGFEDLRIDHSKFNTTSGNRIFDSSPYPIWVAFQLEKSTDDSYRNYLIEISNAHIASYDIYLEANNEVIYTKTQGDNYDFDKREVRHNFFIHNLPDTKENKLNVYFRIDQEGQEVNFPIRIYQRNFFVQDTLRIKMFHGLVIGLFLITTLVTFALFFVNQYYYFVHEVIVSLASIFYILAEEGYGMMMLWPNHPGFNGTSRPLAISVVVIFSLLFTLDFVELGKRKKLCYRISYGLIGVYVLCIIFAHPIDICNIRTPDNIGDIITLFLVFTLAHCILIAGIALWSWVKEKSTDGMVVFFVFLVTLVSIAIRLLALQGYRYNSDIIQHTGFITRAVHVPLIGGYLIYTAIKIYRKSLSDQIELLEEKSTYSKAFIERIDAERQRISMALHDSAGSIITGIKANLQMAKHNLPEDPHYKQTLQLSDQLQQEIRNISNDLLPSSILKLGLSSEINKILSSIEDTYDIQTNFESNLSTKMNADDKIVLHLYYIIREALDNIVKYAKAEKILVQLMKYDDEIQLLIEDDGIGFDTHMKKNEGGNGLKNMTLRVGWLNGEIDIYSADGTSITINIPLQINQSPSLNSL